MERTNIISGLSISLFIIVLFAISSCEKKVELEKFSSKAGRFSIVAPGTFEKDTKNINTNVGPVKCISFKINKRHVSYIVSYVDHPRDTIENSDPDVLLVNARNELLKKIDGKLISEERIAYDKDPGVEFRYSIKGVAGTGLTVLLLTGNRLYQVGAFGTKDNFPVVAAKQYIDSFEIW